MQCFWLDQSVNYYENWYSSIKIEHAVINIDNIGLDLKIHTLMKFKLKAILKNCFYLSVPMNCIKTNKTNSFITKVNHLGRKEIDH